MKRVVSFSGGVGSYCAARRVIQEHGRDDVVLLFADTLVEDEDLYRFVYQGAFSLGCALTVIKDGRTPWQVMWDERMIGNSSIDPCSKILKRHLLDKWRNENCVLEDTICYIGIDWTESHRIETIRERVKPWKYEAPLCNPPYLSKQEMLLSLKKDGIKPPRLYEMGFSHNNCGGACIKAGQAQWALLYRTFPDRYLQIEEWEEEMRKRVGDHAILRDRSGGGDRPLPLRIFRKRLEAKEAFDTQEWGGCGCAL